MLYQDRSQEGVFDRNGDRIFAFDLVKIAELPDYMASETDGDGLSVWNNILGRYAIIVHQENFGRFETKLWRDGGNISLLVLICDNVSVRYYDAFLPSQCTVKIGLNPILYSIFLNAPIEIRKGDLDNENTINYDYIHKVLSLSDSKLKSLSKRILNAVLG